MRFIKDGKKDEVHLHPPYFYYRLSGSVESGGNRGGIFWCGQFFTFDSFDTKLVLVDVENVLITVD